jgi:peptidoglycan LD-endopeptidase CwlK
MPSRDIRDLTAATRERAELLLALCQEHGFPIFLTTTVRTFHEQDELYAQGRTMPGRVVTNAQGGGSFHNYGLAFDFAFVGSEPFAEEHPWSRVGWLGKGLGLEWGGEWSRLPDRGHFQSASPIPVSTLRASAIGRLRRDVHVGNGAVQPLQKALNEAGFEAGAVDGVFGPVTETAVRRFQRGAGRVPNGVVQLGDLDELTAALSRGDG